MQENAVNIVSSTLINNKNYNLKELKIVLNREECCNNKDVKINKDISKNELEYNQDTEKYRDVFQDKVEPEQLLNMDTKTSKKDDSNHTNSVTSQNFKVVKRKLSVFYCELCNDTFQTTMALTRHTQYHVKSNGVIFTCALCGNKFKTNEELINHKVLHESESRCFKCEKCKLAFTSHQHYLQHNIKHINTPFYKCVECPCTFHLKLSYRRHILLHFDKQLKCNFCDATFTQTKDLSKHKRRYHMPGVDCVECGKNCQTRRDYEEHMCLHTGVKLFQCLYCGMGFSRHGGRSVHTRKMHTKYVPHECKVCSQRFQTTTSLKSHMISHEKEKKYECNDCGQQFFHRNSMIQHTRRHMNYMLYSCLMCKRSFATYQYLLQHIEIAHVKNRRFKCEPCNMSFVLKKALKSHFNTNRHRNNVYTCH